MLRSWPFCVCPSVCLCARRWSKMKSNSLSLRNVDWYSIMSSHFSPQTRSAQALMLHSSQPTNTAACPTRGRFFHLALAKGKSCIVSSKSTFSFSYSVPVFKFTKRRHLWRHGKVRIGRFLLNDGKTIFLRKTVLAKIVYATLTLLHKFDSTFLVVTICCTFICLLFEISNLFACSCAWLKVNVVCCVCKVWVTKLTQSKIGTTQFAVWIFYPYWWLLWQWEL